MERKSYSIDINRIAQYAMYAYCIFAVFYLAGNTRQAAFTCMNLISMITTTSAYIYAYYMMYRAIKTK